MQSGTSIGVVSRRAALAGLLAGGVGFALAPYRPRNRADAPAGRVVLRYWEKWTGPEGAAVQRIVDAFNASQERIWVQRVPISNIREKAMLAIAGGDPPDIVGLFSYNVRQYADAGAIIPLTDFDSHGRIAEDSYIPAVHKLLCYRGKQWGGVNTCYNLALYYNKQHFREAGLDPQQPPRTITELDDCARRLTRRDPRDGRIERAGFLQITPNWWPYFWPIPFGGTLYDAEANRATAAAPACIRAYEWLASYPRELGVDSLVGFTAAYAKSFNSAQDPFLCGRVSMCIQGPWIANFARTYGATVELGCGPTPVADELYDPDRPTGLLECDMLMIPRGAPHPAEAFEFLKFTQRPDVQEQLAAAHCKSSPMLQVSPAFFAAHANPYVAVHDTITRSPAVQSVPQIRVWPQYGALIKSAVDAIWVGGAPAPLLQAAESQAQTLIDVDTQRAAERRRLRGGAA